MLETHTARGASPACLVACGLGAAAAVHLLQTHSCLALIGSPLWARAVLGTLATCPAVPALVVAGTMALITVGALVARTRRLCRRQQELIARLERLGERSIAREVILPRSFRSGFIYLLVVLAVQVTASLALGELLPMHGVGAGKGPPAMDMSMLPSPDVMALHLLTSLLCAVVVWSLDRRIVSLSVAVEVLRTRVAALVVMAIPLPPRPTRVLALLHRCIVGQGLLSRPPPHGV